MVKEQDHGDRPGQGWGGAYPVPLPLGWDPGLRPDRWGAGAGTEQAAQASGPT